MTPDYDRGEREGKHIRLSGSTLAPIMLPDNGVPGVSFRVADALDLSYVVSLESRNHESLGFLPKQALSRYIDARSVFLGHINGEPFGYLLFAKSVGVVRVHQACIQYDARRRLYGAALYQWALGQWNRDAVELRCAADLESNLFWQAMGLVCVGCAKGGKRRGRMVNLWRHFLSPELFTPKSLSVSPAFQAREDCKDDTDFMRSLPRGFTDHGSLGKLAWKNRK